jgi:DNA-binding CsgD family transcriptional regulator
VVLIGRASELDRLDALLDEAQAGRSATLLMAGDPGVGKTSLIESLVGAAGRRGFRAVHVTALQTEARLPGALAGLLMGHLGVPQPFDHVPAPGEVLKALGTAAAERPLLVAVDDVQWIDEPSLGAVVFATRRVLADPVAVVLAGRPEIGRIDSLSHLSTLEVPALDEDQALELLRYVAPTVVDQAGRGIVRALAGLPLAIVEAPALLSEEVLHGSQAPPSPIPVGQAVRERYAHGFDALAVATRTGLVLMAVDDSGDPITVQGAWTLAGVSTSDLEPAERAGLVVLGSHPRFVHPLARAAVHAAASPGERRSAHGVLAELYQARGEHARSLRHQAEASTGLDEELASSLEREASRLADQGDLNGGAAIAVRAADLSPAEQDRLRRMVLAAELSPDAVDIEALVSTVQTSAHDPDLRARVVLVQAEGPRGLGVDELEMLLTRIPAESLDEDLRVRLDVNRVWAAITEADVPRLDQLGSELDAPQTQARWDLVATLGMAYTFLGRHDRGVELLRRAVALSVEIDSTHLAGEQLWSWAVIPGWLGEDPADRRARMSYMAGRFRSTGQPLQTATAAFFTAENARRDGHWVRAESYFNEAIDLLRALQLPTSLEEVRLAAALTAYRGEEERTLRLVEDAERQFELDLSRNWNRLWADQARGALALTLGRADQAIAPLQKVAAAPFLGRGCRDAVTCALVDLTEALVVVRSLSSARESANRLAGWLDGIVDPHGLALVQRCLALTRPDDADGHYSAAIALHTRADDPFEAGRTLLLHGEHLRRTRRPREARKPLQEALAGFEHVGATPWSERALRELGAAGQAPSTKARTVASPLTPQELRVAMAVVDGMSNAEAAASLFLSVKTVEFHLSRVYRKLGVRSRGGLARALERSEAGR